MRYGLNLRRLPDRLVRRQPAFRIDQVWRKNSIDKRRLSESSLAYSKKYKKNTRPERERKRDRKKSAPKFISRKNERKHRTNKNDIKLKPALEQLMFDLLRNGVEPHVRLCSDFFGCCHCVDFLVEGMEIQKRVEQKRRDVRKKG